MIKAKLYPYDARYCIVSGAKAIMIDLEVGKVFNLCTLLQEKGQHRVCF